MQVSFQPETYVHVRLVLEPEPQESNALHATGTATCSNSTAAAAAVQSVVQQDPYAAVAVPSMAASRPPCIEASEMSFIQMVRTDDLAVAGDRPIAADADVAIVDPDVADSQFEFMTNLAAEAVTLDASWLVENSFTAPQPVGTVLQLASSLSPMDVDQKEGTNEHRWRLRLKLDYEETVKVEVKPVESSSKVTIHGTLLLMQHRDQEGSD